MSVLVSMCRVLLVGCLLSLIWQSKALDCDQDYSGYGSGDGLLEPLRCVPYSKVAVFNECRAFLSNQNCHLFDYGADFDDLRSTLEQLSRVLHTQSSSQCCTEVAFAYVCNYAYPGCNVTFGTPVGMCYEDCLSVVTEGGCADTFTSLMSVVSLVEAFHLDIQCESVDSRFNYSTESSECFNLSSVLDLTAPPTSEQFPLEWIVPTAVGAPLVMVVGLLCCVFVVRCWRKKRAKRRPIPLQTSVYVTDHRESSSQTNLDMDYQLQRLFMKRASRNEYMYQLQAFFSEDSHRANAGALERDGDELPLFQLLAEDVNRLDSDSGLKDVLLPFKQLCIIEQIAQGAFGRVYRGMYAKSHDGAAERELIPVAIKTIKDVHVHDNYDNVRDFIEECALMHSFHHPHVLGLVGISLDENSSPYLVLPYMENGDLRTFLKTKREVATKSTDTGYPEGLQYDMLVRVCHEIAEGMKYLASRKLVHRDLAARNCMVDRHIRIKVADFGLTRDIYQSDYYIQRLNAKIPVKWMSPESLHDRVSNEKTDVWAYGVTCWEVFSLGRMPYPTITNHEILDYLERGKRLKRPALCSDKMYSLMKKCWHQSPGDRPPFSDIVDIFNSHIIPESCTPTIGNAHYKKHIKGGSSEQSLLSSIVMELKHTPAGMFDEDMDGPDKQAAGASLPMHSDLPQESYLSMHMPSSYYVKMNPILEGVVPQSYYGSYLYENVDKHNVVRGVPSFESSYRRRGLYEDRRPFIEGASVLGASYKKTTM